MIVLVVIFTIFVVAAVIYLWSSGGPYLEPSAPKPKPSRFRDDGSDSKPDSPDPTFR